VYSRCDQRDLDYSDHCHWSARHKRTRHSERSFLKATATSNTSYCDAQYVDLKHVGAGNELIYNVYTSTPHADI